MGKNFEKLNDDELGMINGGAGTGYKRPIGKAAATANGRQMAANRSTKAASNISYELDYICPSCGFQYHLIFYKNNTQNYYECPNCHIEVAKG